MCRFYSVLVHNCTAAASLVRVDVLSGVAGGSLANYCFWMGAVVNLIQDSKAGTFRALFCIVHESDGPDVSGLDHT